MSDMTVKQLADTVGTPVDRLLSQMQDAGLPQRGDDEAVSDEEKQTLLTFLKASHGEKGGAVPSGIIFLSCVSCSNSTARLSILTSDGFTIGWLILGGLLGLY